MCKEKRASQNLDKIVSISFNEESLFRKSSAIKVIWRRKKELIATLDAHAEETLFQYILRLIDFSFIFLTSTRLVDGNTHRVSETDSALSSDWMRADGGTESSFMALSVPLCSSPYQSLGKRLCHRFVCNLNKKETCDLLKGNPGCHVDSIVRHHLPTIE